MNWSDFYMAQGAGSTDQSVVTGPGQSGAAGGTPGASAAPFAWGGLIALLAALYILIRAGAKLSTPSV